MEEISSLDNQGRLHKGDEIWVAPSRNGKRDGKEREGCSGGEEQCGQKCDRGIVNDATLGVVGFFGWREGSLLNSTGRWLW